MKQKEEYEKLIDSSVLFSLNQEREQSLYQREFYKMIELLYNYLMVINKGRYEEYGVEIVETATNCIQNYNPTLGRFLNYFNAAWSKEYKHIKSKELFESDFRAMKFSRSQKRNYIRYKRSCIKLGIDVASGDFDSRIAEDLGLSVEEIKELQLMLESKPESIDTLCDNDDSLMKKQYASSDNIEAEFSSKETTIQLLNRIDAVFSKIQKRQREMMSMLLTSKLALEIDSEDLLMVFKKTSFFNPQTYEMCVSRGHQLQSKEIAEYFGVKEASVSRSWKVFVEKVTADWQD